MIEREDHYEFKEQMEKDFGECGLEGGTFNYSTGDLTFFVSLFNWDENGNPIKKTAEELKAEIDNIKKLIDKGYESKDQYKQNSRYLDNGSRRMAYRNWLQKGEQNRLLHNACSKALAISEAAARYPEGHQESERLEETNEMIMNRIVRSTAA